MHLEFHHIGIKSRKGKRGGKKQGTERRSEVWNPSITKWKMPLTMGRITAFIIFDSSILEYRELGQVEGEGKSI